MGQTFYCAECGEELHEPVKVGSLENYCETCLLRRKQKSKAKKKIPKGFSLVKPGVS